METAKLSRKEKNLLKKKQEQEVRILAAQQEEAREKAIVRAMTFEELVTAVVEMLSEKTGLAVTVERVYEHTAEIHLATLGDVIRLGYTSVTQYSNGRYGVAGTSAGCFMSNHSDKDISNMLDEDFRSLESKANAPKEKS